MSADDYYKNFGLTPVKKKNLQNQLLYNLYKVPKKDNKLEEPHIQNFEKNSIHQADLLFLPDDDGYKYALVVVDTTTGLTDAEPLKNKSSEDVLDGFKKIYQRGILKMPHRLEVDSGGEFKGTLKKYFEDHDCFIRYGQPDRHRQQALAERRNQTLGKILFMRMTAQEILTGETSRQWVEYLPDVIESLNKHVKKLPIKHFSDDPVTTKGNENLLDIGAHVRVALDEPIDVITGKKLNGKFRSTDIRWNPKIRTIKEDLIVPGQPPMYLLDGNVGKRHVTPVAYTKNQLQLVPEKEVPPPPSVIKGKPTTYVVNKIVGKKKVKGKIFYEVNWLGYSDKDNTWESRSELIKDVPDIVAEYEKNNS
jgi:hypothetical protein